MKRLTVIALLPCAMACADSPTQPTAGDASSPPANADLSGWFETVRGGYVHQFNTSIDGGGDFDVNRFAITGGVGYRPDMSKSVSFSAGYDWNNYGFAGPGTGSPWGNIHTLKLGVPVYLGITWNWSREGSISLLGGFRFAGKLAVDDSSGDELSSSDYSSAPFLGFSFDLKL